MTTRASLVLLLIAVGCAQPAAPDKVGQDPKGNLPPDHPPIGPREPSRGMRRMSFSQFERSLAVTTGGVTWTEAGREVLPLLAASMGRPDYVYVTEENLEPNALFLKFASDGSHKVCTDVAAKDRTLAQADKVLTRFVTAADIQPGSPAVTRNLEYLRLRWHGTKRADDPVIPGLRQVVETVVSKGGSVEDGFVAVCVALFNHPDYLLY